MAVDNYFTERSSQFHKSTYQKIFRTNPFRSLIPQSPFDLYEGRVPTVRTLTHELPTAYPTSMAEVGVSDNSGNAQCNPSSTVIKRGEVHRQFKLYQTSFRTDKVCLSDLKRAEEAAQAVAGFEAALNEYIRVWWSDWYRIQNIAMVDTKAVTKASSVVERATNNSDADHRNVPSLPNADLNWDHLKQIYWDLCRNGLADELAIGRDAKGRPVLPLHAGPGIINALWNVDAGIKEQVKFFDSAKNLQHLGYDGAVNGFLPMLDMFPIRYGDADSITAKTELIPAKMIYPTVNEDTVTDGRRYKANSNYMVTTRGGQAQFEVVTILGRDVYEAKYEAADPTQFSEATFSPQNYVGEFQWINNRTFEGDNDRGNLGYYLADIRCGAKPKYPELGVSILTMAREV